MNTVFADAFYFVGLINRTDQLQQFRGAYAINMLERGAMVNSAIKWGADRQAAGSVH